MTVDKSKSGVDRRTFVSSLAVGALSISAYGSAFAADFPARPIQLIIPYPPGGATDIIFRLFATNMQETLGVPVVPVNVEGASSTIGSRRVRDAAPDGYTILGGHDVIATAYLSGIVDYSYDAFETVCLLTQTPNILTTVPDQWADLNAMIEDVKGHPGKYKYGLTPGTSDSFFAIDFATSAGMDLNNSFKFASYKGTGPILKALLAGEVQAGMANYTAARGYYEDGSMVPMAVAFDKRQEQLPDVPTMKELGVDMFNVTSRGIFAPKNTPEPVLVVLQEAFRQAAKSPEVAETLSNLGTIVNFLGAEDASTYFSDLQDKLQEINSRK